MEALVITAAVFYAFSSGFFILYFYRAIPWIRKAGTVCAAGGLLAHFLYAAFSYAYADRLPILSMPEALATFGWAVVLAFVVFLHSPDEEVLGAFVMPVALVCEVMLMISGIGKGPMPPGFDSILFPVHVTFAFVGYAFFVLSFASGLSYIILERRMKSKTTGTLFRRLPPLEKVEDLNMRAITYGFPMLTLAMITGSIWSEHTRGVWWSWDPKEVWTLATWIAYAIPLHLRFMGWKGRRLAYASVVAFIILMFTFLGSSTIFKGYHRF